MSQIGKNFDTAEWDSHDGVPLPTYLTASVIALVEGVLQPLRDEWASPLIIVSGYRTAAWNARIGGALRSTHLTGEGADIRPIHLGDVARLHLLVLSMQHRGALPALGGIGEYPRWIHVDTHKLESGRLRRWRGDSIGSEPST